MKDEDYPADANTALCKACRCLFQIDEVECEKHGLHSCTECSNCGCGKPLLKIVEEENDS